MFFKKAWAILEFLIEEWDELKPIIVDLIATVKAQKRKEAALGNEDKGL